ncbi:ectin-like isoform X4 [Dreissena polymorpha]|uniref:ectin-like isoform X4 n=1 Tax=Dreissena polymorpha TaxID=45954 RepID=UPI0022656C79|nr:ectin-like isoform X4 [Dreissena polymorpha]
MRYCLVLGICWICSIHNGAVHCFLEVPEQFATLTAETGETIGQEISTPAQFDVSTREEVTDITTTSYVECSNSQSNCKILNDTLNICADVPHAVILCQGYCHLCNAVNGNWSEWTKWGTCDVTCGNGTKIRSRKCDNPAPSHGGGYCVGASEDIDFCSKHKCPVHGSWGTWSDWSNCSKECGPGLRNRTRRCDHPEPSADGNHCFGASINYEVCGQQECTEQGFAQIELVKDGSSLQKGGIMASLTRHCADLHAMVFLHRGERVWIRSTFATHFSESLLAWSTFSGALYYV